MDKEETYEQCYACEGQGMQERPLKAKIYDPCEKCGGHGELDWVDNILSPT